MTNENKVDNPTGGDSSQKNPLPDDDGSFFNKVRSDILKKKIEAMLKKDGVIKTLVSELKMPREIVTHLMSQIDDTKQAALGVISKEVRLFFENTNLSEEMTKLLSQLSFEVSTRVRFVRNETEDTASKKKGAVKKTQSAFASEEAQPRQTDISDTTEK
jgi:hypothetical protein